MTNATHFTISKFPKKRLFHHQDQSYFATEMLPEATTDDIEEKKSSRGTMPPDPAK